MQLHGVWFHTCDAPRLAAFQQAVLGETPLREGSHYRFAQAQLAVYDPGETRPTPCKNMSLLFCVPELMAEYARLLRCVPGIAVASPLQRRPWGAYSFRFTDPDGNLVSLLQAPGDAAQTQP